MPDYEPAPEQLDYRPKFDRIHGPDNPRQWRHMLQVVSVPDRSQPRSQEKYAPAIKDQGSEGSCTAHGGTSAAETCQALAGQPVDPLCRMELYVDEREDEGETPGGLQDVGATVADSIDSQLKRHGLGPESQWPYDARPRELPPAGYPNKRSLYVSGHQPIDVSSLDNAINGILAAFDAKQPTVIGFTFYEEFFAQFQATGVLYAKPTSSIAGGHEVFSACVYAPPNPVKVETGKYGLVGYDNSWGLTSPARTDLHPDARAGMIWIPLEAHGTYVTEVHAVTPNVAPVPTPPSPAPEALTLSIIVPATGEPGVQVVVSAAVSGVTPGDTALVVWNWGDGTANGAGLQTAHVYQTAGNYSIQAMAVDSQTGAHSAVMAATVAIATPVPPTPTPPARTIASATITTGGPESGTTFVLTNADHAAIVASLSDGSTVHVP